MRVGISSQSPTSSRQQRSGYSPSSTSSYHQCFQQNGNLNKVSLSGGPQTNNECESWNNDHHQLIGHSHPFVWTAFEAFRIDQAMVTTTLLLNAHDQPPVKRVSCVTVNKNARLQTLCTRLHDDDIDITCFLEGIGHMI